MIGRLRGTLAWKGDGQVLLDVGGVGYLVQVDTRTLGALPAPGGAAVLWTEMLVREDSISLVGFLSMADREWHRLLTSVQGVGAKAALAILGTLGAEGLSRAIALGDAGSIRRAPGVGPKLAQRLVLELKDKAPALMAMGRTPDATPETDPGAVIETPTPAPAQRPASPAGAAPNAQADALSALANLGYAPAEAAAAVAEAAATETETPALIRAALRLLAPKG